MPIIQHEFVFTRNIDINAFFSLMMENRASHPGWKFEHDPSIYTIVWTPTILLNVWQMHPKVTATLEQVSKKTTRCRVTTTNKGFFDPFGIFKRVHKKSYKKLIGPLRDATREMDRTSKGA